MCVESDSLQGIVPKQAIYEAVRVKAKSKYTKIEILDMPEHGFSSNQ